LSLGTPRSFLGLSFITSMSDLLSAAVALLLPLMRAFSSWWRELVVGVEVRRLLELADGQLELLTSGTLGLLEMTSTT